MKIFLNIFFSAYAILLGVAAFSGLKEMATSWGFKDGGLFDLIFSVLGMVIVIFSVWAFKKEVELRGLGEVLSEGIGYGSIQKNKDKNNDS